MAYDIRVNVQTNGQASLDTVDKVLGNIKASSQASATGLKSFEKSLRALSTSGGYAVNTLNSISSASLKLSSSLSLATGNANALLASLKAIKNLGSLGTARVGGGSGRGSGGGSSLSADQRWGMMIARAEAENRRRAMQQQNQFGSGALQIASGGGMLGRSSSAIRGIGTMAGGLGSIVNPATIAAAAIAGVGIALVTLVKDFADAERESQNLADRLGLTVTQAQKLQAEAKITGVNVETLQTAARLLGEALENPTSTGKKAATALRELGVSSIDATGQTRELGPVVLDVIEALSRVPDAAKRAALGQELLGRGAKTLLPLIKNYQELEDIVNKFHVGDDAAGAKELEKANRAIEELDLAWTMFKKHLAEHIAPIIISILTKLTAGSQDANDTEDMLAFDPENTPGIVARNRSLLRNVAPVLQKLMQAGMAGANATAAGVAAAPGLKLAAGFSAHDATTREGLQDQLKELTGERDKLRANLKSGQLLPDSFNQQKGQYDQTVAQIAKVQAALDGLKKDKSDARKAAQEEINLQFQLNEAIGKQATGVEAINAKRDATVQKLAEEGILTNRNLQLVNQIAAAEKARYQQTLQLDDIRGKGEVRNALFTTGQSLSQAQEDRAAKLAEAGGRSQGDTAGGVEAAFRAKVSAIQKEYANAQANITQMQSEADLEQQIRPDEQKKRNDANKIQVAGIEASRKAVLDLYDAETQRELQLQALQKKRFEAEEQAAKNARVLEDASRKSDISDRKSQLSGAQQMLGIQAGPGEVLVTLQKQLAIKQQMAKLDEQESERQLQSGIDEQNRLAAAFPAEAKSAESQIAQLEAQQFEVRRNYEREIGDERIAIELKIAQIQQQQQEEYKNFLQGLVGAAEQGGMAVPKYLRGFGEKTLNTMVGNVADMTFSTVKGLAPSLPGQQNPNGTPNWFGKLLAGTPLGVGQDKMSLANQQKNTLLTQNNTNLQTLNTTISDLNNTLMGKGTGTGTGVPGIGGSGLSSGLNSGWLTGSDLPLLGMGGGATGTVGYLNSTFSSASDTSLFPGGIPMTASGYVAAGLDASQQDYYSGSDLPMDSNPYMGNGYNPSVSSGMNYGQMAVEAGAAGAAAYSAFSDFQSGGMRNDTAGVGASLGGAAAIAAMIPGGQAAALGLGIASAVTSLVSSFMPDPRVQRTNAINKELAQGVYLAPQAQNITQDTSGNFLSIDARGGLQTSNLRAVNTVSEPYIHWNGGYNGTQGFYDVPGVTTSQYSQWPGGSAPGTTAPGQGAAQGPTTININAMDPSSFNDFLQRNHQAVGNAVATNLQSGEGRLSGMVRSVAGTA